MDSDRRLVAALINFDKTVARNSWIYPLNILSNLADNVFDQVQNHNFRFKGDVTSVGSLSTGTAATIQDDTDVVLSITICGVVETTADPEYVKFKLSHHATETWNDCFTDGYLNPKLFSTICYRLVEKYLKDEVAKLEAKHAKPIKIQDFGGVAVTVEYQNLLGYNGMNATADLVFAVRCTSHPILLPKGLGKTESIWPTKATLDVIQTRGMELVAKPNFDENLWRLSFSSIESLLMQDACEMLPCFKRLYRILKAFNKNYLSSTDEGLRSSETTFILRSYHFKTTMLHEVIEFPEFEYWTEEKMAERFYSIIERFETFVRGRCMPHVFIPEVNTFIYGVPTFILQHPVFLNPCEFLEKANQDVPLTVKLVNGLYDPVVATFK